MNEGGVLMKGTPDEVRNNRAVIEAYLGAAGESGGGEE
jgi:ABC-type branched-subunit amino acid transport system ATPase component